MFHSSWATVKLLSVKTNQMFLIMTTDKQQKREKRDELFRLYLRFKSDEKKLSKFCLHDCDCEHTKEDVELLEFHLWMLQIIFKI